MELSRGGIWLAMREVGIGGGKAEEVVFADKELSGSLERVERKRPGAGVDITREERRAIGREKETILVSLGDCRVARMECSASHGDGFGDASRWGKGPIEGALQVLGRDWRGEREAGDLGQGMDSSVGAAGALRQGRFARDSAEGCLELSLDGRQAGLDLPALEVRSIVGEGQLPGLEAGIGLRFLGHWSRF